MVVPNVHKYLGGSVFVFLLFLKQSSIYVNFILGEVKQ